MTKTLLTLLILLTTSSVINAANNHAAESLLHQGLLYLDNNEYESGFNLIKQSADLGNMEAQLELAKLYQTGLGTQKNMDTACNYYLLSYSLTKEAQNNLGWCYVQGHLNNGIPNYNKAFYFYKMAADNGDHYAQDNLGYMYEVGQGTKKNLVLASKYYKLAALQGFEPGVENYIRLNKKSPFKREVIPMSPKHWASIKKFLDEYLLDSDSIRYKNKDKIKLISYQFQVASELADNQATLMEMISKQEHKKIALGYYKAPDKFTFVDGHTVLIEINAKNSMGGYTGYQPIAFYFKDTRLLAVIGSTSYGLLK